MRRNQFLSLGGLAILLALTLYACRKNESVQTETSRSKNYKAVIVPEDVARKIARRIAPDYFTRKHTAPSAGQRTAEIFPITERPVDTCITVNDSYGNAALYVYNFSDSGYLVMSAELKHEPICAYVNQGKVQEYDSVPGPLVQWFEKTVENIEFVRDGSYDNTERGKDAWWKLVEETGLATFPEVTKIAPIDPPPGDDYCYTNWSNTTIGPLLGTTWGQKCSYNELCPDKSCTTVCFGSGKAPTGCVATTMSQIIRYWQPRNSYSYNYASMPATVGNSEVQKLMKDAGHDVGMTYGCGGSGADGAKVPLALKGSPLFGLPGFGFRSADRSSYSQSNSPSVKSNLNDHLPVILEGCSDRRRVALFFWKYSSCHMWITDGYMQSQNNCYSYLWYHMNWGWHETFGLNDHNGWFIFNNWAIPSTTDNFQYANDFIYNIYP